MGQSCTLIVEMEVMAPCTYVGLALGVAPGGCISFGSLRFADIDGPAHVNGLLLGQAQRFRDQDFVADRLGWLWLNEENAALPYISMPDHGLTRAGPVIVDSNALACSIDAYLRANPRPEPSQRVFYVLANAFAQLSGSGPLPLEAKFGNLMRT